MLFRKFFVLVFVIASSNLVWSQKHLTDSIVAVDEVVVSSYRYQSMALGTTVSIIDTIVLKSAQTQSLSDILSQQGGITISSYGIGGLSEAKVRGNASEHTAIVWNDINLQSPMNGGVNLAVIPVCLLDNVSVQFGGSGVAYGSGAMSGIIHIGNEDLFNKSAKGNLNISIGSFGNKIISGGGNFQKDKFASSLRIFGQENINNFRYFDSQTKNPSFKNLENAGLSQYGLLQENQIKTSEHTVFKTSFWFQHYDKDLQPMISKPFNISNQKDNNVIATGNWKYLKSDYSIAIKGGMIYNQIYYRDVYQKTNDNNSTSGIGEVEFKKVFSSILNLHTGINNTYEVANSGSYSKQVSRNRSSVYASVKSNLFNNRAHFSAGVRSESVDLKISPITYAFGGEIEPLQKLIFKANFSTNYKLPTLNELYWKEDLYASGNPDLLPESGWSGDFGIKTFNKISFFSYDLTANIYYSNINNWIVWEPNNLNKGKWMPDNRDNGKSYGFEIHNSNKFELSSIILKFNNEYTYNISKVVKSDGKSVNEPLYYNPRHHYMLFTSGSIKGFTLMYIQNFFSRQLYDLTSFSYLSKYYIADIALNTSLTIKHKSFGLNFRINNIWNKNYQVRYDYAMPGRNFMLSANMSLY